MENKAKPGSNDAVRQGCLCPIYDNAHGRGYLGTGEMFVISHMCPIHADPADVEKLDTGQPAENPPSVEVKG
jgi:hypothetical protein